MNSSFVAIDQFGNSAIFNSETQAQEWAFSEGNHFRSEVRGPMSEAEAEAEIDQLTSELPD